MSISLWHHEVRPAATKTLYECDVCIIGAGIAGLAMAFLLEQEGQRVVILEAGTVGCEATGRNAGFLIRGAADNYSEACKLYGRPLARRLWKLSERTLQLVLDACGGPGALPSYRRVPSCILALTDAEERDLQESIQMMRADGLRVEQVTSGTDPVWRSGLTRIGLINPDDGAVNPMDVLGCLVRKIRGVLLENTPARQIREVASSEYSEVEGDFVRVRCRRALCCAGPSIPFLFPETRKWLEPNKAEVFTFDATGRDLLQYSYYINHGGEYVRSIVTRDGHHRILVGGCRRFFEQQEKTYGAAVVDNVQERLLQFAMSIFPGIDVKVSDRWAGTMTFTPDGLPVMGPVTSQGVSLADGHGNSNGAKLWIFCACNGHGMSMTFGTAEILRDVMLKGAANPFSPSRFAVAKSKL